MTAIFGNIEDIKHFHKVVMLPMLEKAVKDSNILRLQKFIDKINLIFIFEGDFSCLNSRP